MVLQFKSLLWVQLPQTPEPWSLHPGLTSAAAPRSVDPNKFSIRKDEDLDMAPLQSRILCVCVLFLFFLPGIRPGIKSQTYSLENILFTIRTFSLLVRDAVSEEPDLREP